MENEDFYHEGSTELVEGTQIEVRGHQYKLTRSLTLAYIDWQGAYAGIYFKSPIKENDIHVFGPNFEEGDINVATQQFISLLARKFDHLIQLDAKDRKGEDKTDFEGLSGLLVAA